jgi:hypothetical protein
MWANGLFLAGDQVVAGTVAGVSHNHLHLLGGGVFVGLNEAQQAMTFVDRTRGSRHGSNYPSSIIDYPVALIMRVGAQWTSADEGCVRISGTPQPAISLGVGAIGR